MYVAYKLAAAAYLYHCNGTTAIAVRVYWQLMNPSATEHLPANELLAVELA